MPRLEERAALLAMDVPWCTFYHYVLLKNRRKQTVAEKMRKSLSRTLLVPQRCWWTLTYIVLRIELENKEKWVLQESVWVVDYPLLDLSSKTSLLTMDFWLNSRQRFNNIAPYCLSWGQEQICKAATGFTEEINCFLADLRIWHRWWSYRRWELRPGQKASLRVYPKNWKVEWRGFRIGKCSFSRRVVK